MSYRIPMEVATMFCPKDDCGSEHISVVRTDKNLPGNTIRRIRFCHDCGRTWATREVESDELPGGGFRLAVSSGPTVH